MRGRGGSFAGGSPAVTDGNRFPLRATGAGWGWAGSRLATMIPSPMLLSSCSVWPRGDGWVLEPKWDGYRCVARVSRDGVALWTRHGTPLAPRVPAVASALAGLPAGTVLDGELVALRAVADGRVAQDWDALRALWGGAWAEEVDLRMVCFDCLEDGGRRLDELPWRT